MSKRNGDELDTVDGAAPSKVPALEEAAPDASRNVEADAPGGSGAGSSGLPPVGAQGASTIDATVRIPIYGTQIVLQPKIPVLSLTGTTVGDYVFVPRTITAGSAAGPSALSDVQAAALANMLAAEPPGAQANAPTVAPTWPTATLILSTPIESRMFQGDELDTVDGVAPSNVRAREEATTDALRDVEAGALGGSGAGPSRLPPVEAQGASTIGTTVRVPAVGDPIILPVFTLTGTKIGYFCHQVNAPTVSATSPPVAAAMDATTVAATEPPEVAHVEAPTVSATSPSVAAPVDAPTVSATDQPKVAQVAPTGSATDPSGSAQVGGQAIQPAAPSREVAVGRQAVLTARRNYLIPIRDPNASTTGPTPLYELWYEDTRLGRVAFVPEGYSIGSAAAPSALVQAAAQEGFSADALANVAAVVPADAPEVAPENVPEVAPAQAHARAPVRASERIRAMAPPVVPDIVLWEHKDAFDWCLRNLADLDQFLESDCYSPPPYCGAKTIAFLNDVDPNHDADRNGDVEDRLVMLGLAWEPAENLRYASEAIQDFEHRFLNGQLYEFPTYGELIERALANRGTGEYEVIAVLGARNIMEKVEKPREKGKRKSYEEVSRESQYLTCYGLDFDGKKSDIKYLKDDLLVRELSPYYHKRYDLKLINYQRTVAGELKLPDPTERANFADFAEDQTLKLHAKVVTGEGKTKTVRPMIPHEVLGIENGDTSLIVLSRYFEMCKLLVPNYEIQKTFNNDVHNLRFDTFFQHFNLYNEFHIGKDNFINVRAFFKEDDTVVQANFVNFANDGPFSMRTLRQRTKHKRSRAILVCQSPERYREYVEEMEQQIDELPLAQMREYLQYALAMYVSGKALNCDSCMNNWMQSGKAYFRRFANNLGVAKPKDVVFVRRDGRADDEVEEDELDEFEDEGVQSDEEEGEDGEEGVMEVDEEEDQDEVAEVVVGQVLEEIVGEVAEVVAGEVLGEVAEVFAGDVLGEVLGEVEDENEPEP